MCTSAPPNAWCAVKPPPHRTSVVFCHELGIFLMATSFSESWIFNCFGTVQDGPRMTTEMMGKWWANPLVVQICPNHLALPCLTWPFAHFWTPSYILDEEAWQHWFLLTNQHFRWMMRPPRLDHIDPSLTLHHRAPVQFHPEMQLQRHRYLGPGVCLIYPLLI